MAVYHSNNAVLPLQTANIIRAPSTSDTDVSETEDKSSAGTVSTTCYDLEELLAASQLPMEAFSLNSSLTDTEWLQSYNPAAAAVAASSLLSTTGTEGQREENRNPNLLVNPLTLSADPEHNLMSVAAAAIAVTQHEANNHSSAGSANRVHLTELRDANSCPTAGGSGLGGGVYGSNGGTQHPHHHQQQQLARHGYSPIAPRSIYPSGGGGVAVGVGGRLPVHPHHQELGCNSGYISSTTGPISPLSNGSGSGQYQKPGYSYSCLIALSLENSRSGMLPVSEIYGFMTTHFPYFRTAPDGWKNSVRHNLSLNKSFMKIENPAAATDGSSTRKGCLWGIHNEKKQKMREEICKWNRKDGINIKRSMAHPDLFEELERGNGKNWPRGGGGGVHGPHQHHPHPHPLTMPPSGSGSRSASTMRTVTVSELALSQQHSYQQQRQASAPADLGMSARVESVDPGSMYGGGREMVSNRNSMTAINGGMGGSAARTASEQQQLAELSLSELNFPHIMWDGLSGELINGGPMTGSPTAFLNSPTMSPTSSNSAEDQRYRATTNGSGIPYGVCTPTNMGSPPEHPYSAAHAPQTGSNGNTPTVRSISAS